MNKISSNQKIVPFLWFDNQAEKAANFYTGIFPDSCVSSVNYYPNGGPYPDGSVMSANFILCGQQFYTLNGGPNFKFNPAISLFVNCEDQKEVDHYWNNLIAGGRADQCGWLVDQFGVSWQIIPRQLGQLLGDKDPGRASRAIQAMLKMQKIIIADLENAANG